MYGPYRPYGMVPKGTSVTVRLEKETPAMEKALGEEERARLRQALLGPWKKIFMISMALVLASGFYNFAHTSIPKAKESVTK